MTVRELRDEDLPTLEAMAAKSGFPYIDPRSPLTEAVLVVADGEDRPVAAVAAERIVQLYGWFDQDLRPMRKMQAIRLLHESMASELKKKGYNSAEAFIPTSICERFGRRLEKSFGWSPNWRSWSKGF